MSALAIASVVSSLASAGMSAWQMIQQKRLMENAQDAAERSFQEARRRLSINYFEGLSIQKEPYALQREALMVSASQALDAARESSRGAGAAAGLVQMAHLAGEERVTTAMQQELANRERLILGEDARLQGLQADLALGEAEGAQLAAADRQNMMNQATANMMQGVTNAALVAANSADLYKQNKVGKNDFSQQTQLGASNFSGLGEQLSAMPGASSTPFMGSIQPQPIATQSQQSLMLSPEQQKVVLDFLTSNPQYAKMLGQ